MDLGRWSVTVEWRSRPDDVSGCAQRLGAMLRGLAALNPALDNWATNVGETVGHRSGMAVLARLVEHNWDREARDGILGSTIGLGADMRGHDHRDPLTRIGLTVHCGSRDDVVHNNVVLRVPAIGLWPELSRLETALRLCDVMIDAWQPRWCNVRPRTLTDATREPHTTNVLGSWLIHLDRDAYTRTGDLPTEVEVRDAPGGHGDILILAPTADRVRLDTVARLRQAITCTYDGDRLR